MASSAADLATVSQNFSDEETTLQQLITQAVSGDLNAKTVLLPAEIATAQQLRATMLASVPDADTSGLDSIIANAQNVAGGTQLTTAPATAAPATPGLISASGIKIGPVLIPWVGVG
ncbi:MAG TPA: hypothetical protein VGL62_11925, partial [Vicinamibacterales bacterium]